MLEYLGFHQSFAHRAEAVPSDPRGDTVVCGHTHMTFVRLAHGRLVSNPGSIGMPYGRTGGHWALGPGVELGTTHFDIEAAAAQHATDANALEALAPRDGRDHSP
jgi:predicted phosphodiesterase